MRYYEICRETLVYGVLVVLFVSVLVFAIMQAMPGNPVDLMVDTRVSAEKVAEIKAQWGLDEPPVVPIFLLDQKCVAR